MLWLIEGHLSGMALRCWLDGRDPRLYAVIVEYAEGGPLHWIGCRGVWVCDGGRWSRDRSPARWAVKAAYAVTPG